MDTPRVDPGSASSPETTEKPGGTPDNRHEARRGRPPRLKATDERVQELLTSVGYNREVTPEVLEQHRRFATHAGKPGLPRWKAAVAVLNPVTGRQAWHMPGVAEVEWAGPRRVVLFRMSAHPTVEAHELVVVDADELAALVPQDPSP